MLRLRDNCLILSSSSLEKITTCPRQAYYSLVRERVKAAPDPAMAYGSIIHAALAFRFRCEYHHLSYENKLDAVLTHQFKHQPEGSEDYRNLSFASDAIQDFNKTYPTPWGVVSVPGAPYKPFVERSFAVKAGVVNGVTIIYIGIIDLVVQRETGYFVVDTKTTALGGDAWWDELGCSEQLHGYCWAFQQATGIEPVGYIINGIIGRKPTKTGIAHECKSLTVFTAEPASRLAAWHQNMLMQCEEFLYWHRRDAWPMFRKGHCINRYNKRCDYFDVCSLADPSQQDILLASQAFKNHKLNPRYI